VQPVDVEAGDVDVGAPVHDPVGEHPPEPSPRQDSDRVQARRDEVVLELRRLSHDGLEVRGEALRAAEELPDPGLERDGDALHRSLDVRAHAVPVGRNLAEREVLRNATDVPRRADGLEEADHQPPALLSVVAMGRRVLEHRPGRRQLADPVGDEVVVLGRLKRDVDSPLRAELPRPHPCAVDDILGLHVPERRRDARDDAALREEASDRHALLDLRALHARPLRERHRGVDRVHATIFFDVETSEQIVGLRERPEIPDLARRDLVHIDTAIPVERRDAPVLLQPILVPRYLDEAHRLPPRRQLGLRFEARVEIARVLPHLRRGLGGGPERHHEPRRVPGSPRRQTVSLQEEDVGAHVGEVVRDRTADDSPAYDDYSRTLGELGFTHGSSR
jgi:hypothetical protein